jgi:hypothetical protein
VAGLTVCFTKGRYFIWQTGAIARVFWAPVTEITDLVYFLLFGSIVSKFLSMEIQFFLLKYSFCSPLESVAVSPPSTPLVTTIRYNLPARVWASNTINEPTGSERLFVR